MICNLKLLCFSYFLVYIEYKGGFIKKFFFLLTILFTYLPNNYPQNFWERTNAPYPGTDVISLCFDSSSFLFAGTNGAGIFGTSNNGETWIEKNNGMTANTIVALAVSAYNHIFAATNEGIFRSSDSGENWIQINNGLATLNIRCLAISPNHNIFAGSTDSGIFRSTDNGENWTQINSGLSNNDIYALADNSDVPVINMLDDFAHPCQILCDFQTIKEKKGGYDGLKLSFYGDSFNNVTYDLMRMCAMFGMKMDVACPDDVRYKPDQEVLAEIAEISAKTGAVVRVVHDAKEAAKDADILYADSWMSYGIPKEEEEERVKIFMPFQVNSEVMAAAKPDAIFMNCLPAMRGYEESAEVIDGPQSIVFDQAANRLHVQKAIILFLLGKMD